MHAVKGLGVVRCELFSRFLYPGQLRIPLSVRIVLLTCAIAVAVVNT